MRRRIASSVGISSALASYSSMASGSAALRIPTLPLRTFRPVSSEKDGGPSSSTGPALEDTSVDMPIIGLGTYKFKKGTGEVT